MSLLQTFFILTKRLLPLRPFFCKRDWTGFLSVQRRRDILLSQTSWGALNLVVNNPQCINHLFIYFFVDHELIKDIFISEVKFICNCNYLEKASSENLNDKESNMYGLLTKLVRSRWLDIG